MILPDKSLLYGWGGLNVTLFHKINSLNGEWYDSLMMLLSKTGDHKNFPYYMMFLLAYVLIALLVRNIQKKGGNKAFLAMWFSVFIVLVAGYGVTGLTAKLLKDEFAYPRPYVVQHNEDMRLLEYRSETDDDFHSFPSGHATFITLMIAGLWPVLSSSFRTMGVLLVFGVCWSRIAVGMHYPADVLGGFLMSLILVMIIRACVNWTLNKLGIRC